MPLSAPSTQIDQAAAPLKARRTASQRLCEQMAPILKSLLGADLAEPYLVCEKDWASATFFGYKTVIHQPLPSAATPALSDIAGLIEDRDFAVAGYILGDMEVTFTAGKPLLIINALLLKHE